LRSSISGASPGSAGFSGTSLQTRAHQQVYRLNAPTRGSRVVLPRFQQLSRTNHPPWHRAGRFTGLGVPRILLFPRRRNNAWTTIFSPVAVFKHPNNPSVRPDSNCSHSSPVSDARAARPRHPRATSQRSAVRYALAIDCACRNRPLREIQPTPPPRQIFMRPARPLFSSLPARKISSREESQRTALQLPIRHHQNQRLHDGRRAIH